MRSDTPRFQHGVRSEILSTMPKLADRYPFPAPEGSHWRVPQDFDVTFNWDYDEGRATMMGLYRKGVEMQWNAESRIDWSQELDEENPEQLPEAMLPIAGMAEYEAMDRKGKATVRRHFQAWQISQFMQGEQGALICAANAKSFSVRPPAEWVDKVSVTVSHWIRMSG